MRPDNALASMDAPYPLSATATLGRVPRGRADFFGEVSDQYGLVFLRACATRDVPGDVVLSLVRVARPPVIMKPSGDVSVEEGKILTIPIQIVDPDGADYGVAVTGLPRFATFDGASTITCSPGLPDSR